MIFEYNRQCTCRHHPDRDSKEQACKVFQEKIYNNPSRAQRAQCLQRQEVRGFQHFKDASCYFSFTFQTSFASKLGDIPCKTHCNFARISDDAQILKHEIDIIYSPSANYVK